MEKLINKKALFVECKSPTREPDWIEKDACYWQEKDFLYRESKNWSDYHSYKRPIFHQYKTGELRNNNLFSLWLKKPIKLNKDGKNRSLKLFIQLLDGNYTVEEFGELLNKELNNEPYLNNKPLCGKVKWTRITEI